MDVLEQIQSYAPNIEKETALSFTERAASLFLNSLPELVANNHFIQEEIPVDGLEIGNRYSFILRGKYMCRMTRPDMVPLHKDEESIHNADELDPLFYIQDGKIYVLPEPTDDKKAYVSKIPEITINREETLPTSIPNLPKEASHIVLLYAGFFSNFYLAQKDRESSSELETDYNQKLIQFENTLPSFEKIEYSLVLEAPSAPDIESDIINKNLDIDIPDFDLNFSEEEIPKFEEPTAQEPNVDLSSAEEALENAKEFIGSIDNAETVPKGAYWLDDEDPEMVRSSVELAAQEVNRANGYSNTQLQTLKAYEQSITNKYTLFKAQIDSYIKDIEAKSLKVKSSIEAFNSKLNAQINEANFEVQKELQHIQAEVNLYSSKVSSFQAEANTKLQDYQTKVQENIQQFSGNLQKASSILSSMNAISQKFQLFANSYKGRMQEAERLYQQYMQEFKNYIGADNAGERPVRGSRKG